MAIKHAYNKEKRESYFLYWQSILDKNEWGTIFSIPISGNNYRINEFLEWQKKTQKQPASLVHIHIEQITDKEDVEKCFASTKAPLIVYPGEDLLKPDLIHLIETFVQLQNTHHRGLLLFTESLPTTIENLPLSTYHTLIEHTSFIPMFDYQNSKYFLKKLAKKWSFTLTEKQIKDIYYQTGGHTWLLKEVARQISKNDTTLLQTVLSEPYVYRVNTIWNELPFGHQQIIKKVVSGTPLKDLPESPHKQDITNLQLIPNNFIPNFWKQAIENQVMRISLDKNNNIIINKVVISQVFTQRELLFLKTLILNKQINRTLAANCFWKEEDYSEWALDKAIQRIRKKLTNLGVSKSILVTIKNSGYLLNQ